MTPNMRPAERKTRADTRQRELRAVNFFQTIRPTSRSNTHFLTVLLTGQQQQNHTHTHTHTLSVCDKWITGCESLCLYLDKCMQLRLPPPPPWCHCHTRCHLSIHANTHFSRIFKGNKTHTHTLGYSRTMGESRSPRQQAEREWSRVCVSVRDGRGAGVWGTDFGYGGGGGAVTGAAVAFDWLILKSLNPNTVPNPPKWSSVQTNPFPAWQTRSNVYSPSDCCFPPFHLHFPSTLSQHSSFSLPFNPFRVPLPLSPWGAASSLSVPRHLPLLYPSSRGFFLSSSLSPATHLSPQHGFAFHHISFKGGRAGQTYGG